MKYDKLPFSLFDFFAIFFPGAIGTAGVWLFTGSYPDLLNNVEGNVSLTLALIALCYLAGHVLHAASEIFIDRYYNKTEGSIVGQYLHRMGLAEKRTRSKDSIDLFSIDWNPDSLFEWRGLTKTDDDKTDGRYGKLIIKCLKNEFGDYPKQIKHIFELVLTHAQKSTSNEYSEVPTFAAIETMFQSLILAAFIFLAGFLRGFYSVLDWFWLLTVGIVILLLIDLFYYAHQRYKRMWVETIFAQFVVASMAKTKNKDG